MNHQSWNLSPNLPIDLTSKELGAVLDRLANSVRGSHGVLSLRIGVGDRHEMPDFVRKLSQKAELSEPDVLTPQSDAHIRNLIRRTNAEPIVIVNAESLSKSAQKEIIERCGPDMHLAPPYVLLVTTLEPNELVANGRWSSKLLGVIRQRAQMRPITERTKELPSYVRAFASAMAVDKGSKAKPELANRVVEKIVQDYHRRRGASLSVLGEITYKVIQDLLGSGDVARDSGVQFKGEAPSESDVLAS